MVLAERGPFPPGAPTQGLAEARREWWRRNNMVRKWSWHREEEAAANGRHNAKTDLGTAPLGLLLQGQSLHLRGSRGNGLGRKEGASH